MTASTTRKLVSHGGIYFAGNVMRRIVSFVMLPVYTTYLTPADYGTLELLQMVIDVAGILFGLRLAEGVYRYYFATEDARERNQVMFTAFALAFLLQAVGVVSLVAGASPIARFVLEQPDAVRLVQLFALTLVAGSMTELSMMFLRVQQRPWLFVGFSLLKLVVQLSLNIYFVVVLRMTVMGVILSSLISSVVVSIPLAWQTIARTGFTFSGAKARQLVAFSLPLIATSLMSFYLTFGDRFFLQRLGGGLDAVGVYALAYKFGFLLAFIVGDPFFSIWDSERYPAFRQPNGLARFRTAFLMLTTGMAVVCVALSVYIGDFLRLMADPAFAGAAQIVPIVLLAYVLQNYTAFSNFGLLLERRTGEIAKGTALAAVVITAGYLLLIPRFGGSGAAFATLLAFLARALWIGWRANSIHPLHLPWGRALKIFSLGAAAWIASTFAPRPIVLSIAVHTSIFVAFLIALAVSPGLLPRDIRERLRALVAKRRLSFD